MLKNQVMVGLFFEIKKHSYTTKKLNLIFDFQKILTFEKKQKKHVLDKCGEGDQLEWTAFALPR